MRFGVYALPTYFPEEDGAVADFYRHTLSFLEDCERLGFERAWVNEHHFHPFGGMIPCPPVMLAAVAARTTRIRIGTSVAVLPLHHPLELAEQYAMVDQISGGRLEFGIGSGFLAHDHETMGVSFDDRAERTEECLQVVLAAWRGRTFDFEGRFHRFSDAQVWPQPMQTPHPPVWAAATRNPASFAWAGRQGFDLLTVGYVKPLDEQAELIRIYREAAAAAGHDPHSRRISTHYLTCVDEDGDAARRRVGQAMERYLALSRAARTLASDLSSLPRERLDVGELLAEGRLLAGTPAECAESIERAGERLGLDGVDCSFYFGGIDYPAARRSFELFAREVIPRVRRGRGPAGCRLPAG